MTPPFPNYAKQTIAYISTKFKDKKLPKFKEATIIDETEKRIKTDGRTYQRKQKNICRKLKSHKRLSS